MCEALPSWNKDLGDCDAQVHTRAYITEAKQKREAARHIVLKNCTNTPMAFVFAFATTLVCIAQKQMEMLPLWLGASSR